MQKILLVHKAAPDDENDTTSQAILATPEQAAQEVRDYLKRYGYTAEIPTPEHDLDFRDLSTENWAGCWIVWGNMPKAGKFPEGDGVQKLLVDGKMILIWELDTNGVPITDPEYYDDGR